MEDKKEVPSVQMQMQPSNGIASGTDFTQTRNGVAKCFNLSRGAKALWTEMYSYCYLGGDIFAGVERMSINLGVSKATIMRDTKELIDIGLVTVEHRSFNQTNMYTLYDANDLDIPNGSNTYIKSHPEEFDGYKWLGREEKVVSPCNHVVAPADLVVAPVVPEENKAVKHTKPIKNIKHMSSTIKTPVTATPKEIKSVTKRLVKCLNVTAGKNFKPGKNTVTLIGDLITNGVKEDEVRLVVDFKASRWIGDSKMDEYLRPKTLFSEKNFDDYLQEAILWNKNGRKTKGSLYNGVNADDDYSTVVQ